MMQGSESRQPPEAGKGKEMDDSLEPPEGTQPCQFILDFWPRELLR